LSGKNNEFEEQENLKAQQKYRKPLSFHWEVRVFDNLYFFGDFFSKTILKKNNYINPKLEHTTNLINTYMAY
jgi:hypothetical protein